MTILTSFCRQADHRFPTPPVTDVVLKRQEIKQQLQQMLPLYNHYVTIMLSLI